MPRGLVESCLRSAGEPKEPAELGKHVQLLTTAPSHLAAHEQGMLSRSAHQPSDGLKVVFKWPWFVRRQYVLENFSAELKRHRPDVVHVDYASWSPVTLQTALLMRRAAPKARLVLTIRKNTYLPKPAPFEQVKSALRQVVDRQVAAYIAESEMAREMSFEWFGIAPTRMHICRQLGVDMTIFRPRSEPRADGPLVVGFAGALCVRKGILDLVDAVAQLVEQGRAVTLRVVGSGPLEEQLKARASGAPWLKLGGSLPHEAVAPFLQDCDVFVIPSRNEPDHQEHDGHAVMKAVACGLPVIVTRSGIMPELVVEGSGMFVREGHVRDLAAAIAWMMRLRQSPRWGERHLRWR